jgi:hypothetical protein
VAKKREIKFCDTVQRLLKILLSSLETSIKWEDDDHNEKDITERIWELDNFTRLIRDVFM